MSNVLATAALSVILASASAPPAPTAKSADKAPVDTKQYCLTFAPETGSRLSTTECRTKKQWKQVGVDVDDLAAQNGAGKGGFA